MKHTSWIKPLKTETVHQKLRNSLPHGKVFDPPTVAHSRHAAFWYRKHIIEKHEYVFIKPTSSIWHEGVAYLLSSPLWLQVERSSSGDEQSRLSSSISSGRSVRSFWSWRYKNTNITTNLIHNSRCKSPNTKLQTTRLQNRTLFWGERWNNSGHQFIDLCKDDIFLNYIMNFSNRHLEDPKK